ncbi:MAG: DUF2065 domain-containing protein [Proteobacteria bacterium]|nr:MAG: DUF2065 domain-containing protein [Pseudomonadota bacterium]
MIWSDLLAALALYLVLEGIMPFLNPQWTKRFMSALATMGDRSIRLGGLVSMAAGVVLLYVVRG